MWGAFNPKSDTFRRSQRKILGEVFLTFLDNDFALLFQAIFKVVDSSYGILISFFLKAIYRLQLLIEECLKLQLNLSLHDP